ncbi:MAG TPA: gamma-glutamyltransferase family protein, partial [Ktedonobacterales bacterium]
VYPQLNGLGGDLFCLLWDARSERLYGLNASGRASAAASIERYHALGYDSMPPFGIHTITVPGCPDGWRMLSERFGRVGLARALQGAIAYAEGGFPVGPGLHAALARMDTLPYTHRAFRAHFMPDGNIPAAGSIMRRPELAATLRRIAEQGAGDFYRGELAGRIADFFAQEGGLITAEDLAAHTGEWVEPLSVRFGDLEVFELPPNTQGVTALQMLGMVNGLALGESPLATATVHAGVEAKKLAFADRDAYLTDLAHMTVSPEDLIAPKYLAGRRELISATRTQPSVAPGSTKGDTIYLCTADEAGNCVSLIQSNYRGFGSGVVVEGTGIALQNRGAYFSLNPESANALAPNKRTLHTLIPSLALRDGRPAVVFGAMGGDGQPQTHLQFYTALVRYGLNVQAAIELPRWVDGVAALGTPERLWLEARYPEATVEALRALGHNVAPLARWDAQVGHANGIVIDEQRGVLHGGSDPRAEGAAVGW